MFELSPLIFAAIPIVVGLVEVVKKIGMDSKFAPVLSILFGVGAMFLASSMPDQAMTWQAWTLQGIITGLSASGLYSGGAKTIAAIKG